MIDIVCTDDILIRVGQEKREVKRWEIIKVLPDQLWFFGYYWFLRLSDIIETTNGEYDAEDVKKALAERAKKEVAEIAEPKPLTKKELVAKIEKLTNTKAQGKTVEELQAEYEKALAESQESQESEDWKDQSEWNQGDSWTDENKEPVTDPATAQSDNQ